MSAEFSFEPVRLANATPVNGCALLLAIRRSLQYRIIPTPLYEPEWRTAVRDSISELGITFDTSSAEHYTPGHYSLPYIITYGIVYAFYSNGLLILLL